MTDRDIAVGVVGLSQADLAGQVDAEQVKDLLAAISASDDNTEHG